MRFIAELKRRNVIRMAGLYLVGAWLVVQVAATLLPVFEAPAWVMKVLVAVLAIGLVAALVFAWVFELTPEGLRRDADVAVEASIAPQTGKRLDRMIRVVLMLAVAYFAFDKFVLAPKRVATERAGTVAEPGKGASPATDQSIAVLAFDNRSPDPDNEYFSDGVAEEILNSLAKVDGLKVAGRASSFYFKGRNESPAAMGRALGVAHLLEGSVRKQGSRLRITAQLLRVSDGFQLWSDAYDGSDADVFALQESIARNVTDALRIALDTGPQSLVHAGTRNAEAYSLYLQASSIFNRRDRAHFQNAIEALQKSLQLDPQFARAHARLASLYVVLSSYTDADPKTAHGEVMRHAELALAIDAQSAEAWAARGASLRKFRQTQLQGFDAFEQAMQLDPNDVTTRFWYGLTLLQVGYRRRGTEQIERALALDPLLPNALRWRGMLYWQDGDHERAAPMLQRAYDLGLVNTANALSEVAMWRGDAAGSARLWLEGSMGLDFGMTRDELAAAHRGIFGDAEARREGVQILQGVLGRMRDNRALPTLPLYLFRLGEPALGLKILGEREMGERIDAMNWIWTREGTSIRAVPEFQDFLRDHQLPEIWDKYGAPDLCRKDPQGRWVCQ